jgi:tetratricopeptide (TPR) repeat protein
MSASSSSAGASSASIIMSNKVTTLHEKFNAYIHQCYTRKDFPMCLKKIDEQLRLSNGQSEYPLYIKALILRHQGRIEESLTCFQAALSLNPTNVNNLKQVGRSLYLLGKHKSALDVFNEAEKLLSEDRDIWHNKGMCHLYLKQYDMALDCFVAAPLEIVCSRSASRLLKNDFLLPAHYERVALERETTRRAGLVHGAIIALFTINHLLKLAEICSAFLTTPQGY